MGHPEQIFTWAFLSLSFSLTVRVRRKSCVEGDAAMNDKTLKCITMMSHEIKGIHRTEHYLKNMEIILLPARKTSPCI